jgi:hypothetical protein
MNEGKKRMFPQMKRVPKKRKTFLIFPKGCYEVVKDHCEGMRVPSKNLTKVYRDIISKRNPKRETTWVNKGI